MRLTVLVIIERSAIGTAVVAESRNGVEDQAHLKGQIIRVASSA